MRALITILLTLLFGAVFSQHGKIQVEYINIDYLKDNGFVHKSTAPYQSKAGLRISNINKKLVTVNSTVTSTTFNETTPPIFTSFFDVKLPSPPDAAGSGLSGGDLALLSQNDINSATIPDSLKATLADLQRRFQALGNELQSMENVIKNYRDNYRRLQKIIQFHTVILDLQNLCNTPFLIIVTQLNAETKTLLFPTEMGLPQPDKAILLLQPSADPLVDYIACRGVLTRYLDKVLHEAEEDYSKIEQFFLPANIDRITTALEKLNLAVTEEANAVFQPAFMASTETKRVHDNLSSETLEQKLAMAFENLKYINDQIKFEDLQQKISNFSTEGRKAIFDAYDYLNEGNYTLYIKPETIDKDEVTIAVDIMPMDGIACAPIPRNYELRLRPKGGIKIDFSTGFFLNFSNRDFRDQSYRYDTIAGQPDQRVITKNKSKSQVFPSVGALMHIYPRNGKDVHVGGCFGLSIKDLDQLNYHLGASFVFGYADRFILNTGLTLTRATLIDDKYEVGQYVEAATAPDPVPTSKFNRLGFFAAFSYNFTSK